MSLKFEAKNDLEADEMGGSGAWRSTGNDPFFNISYPIIRKPIIVVFLKSDDVELDPKIYLNRGAGYTEDNSIGLPSGRQFIIVADVGGTGWNRSFRIDPASFPCNFELQIEAFANIDEAEHAIVLKQFREMKNALRADIGRLPRFGLQIPLPQFGVSKTRVGKFAKAQYRLAAALPAAAPPTKPGQPVWLSIVVPVYNAPKRYLDDLVRSFETQNISGTQLILSDDASNSRETLNWYDKFQTRDDVQIVRNAVNGGIAKATNAGLAQASGIWVTLLDHDDVIAPHAFKVLANTLAEHNEAQFVFTDELVVNDHLKPIGVMLKPAYDSVLLTGVNYINHFSIYRRERLEEIGYLRLGFDGSQDYDLVLRYLDGIPESQILHLPYLAYWWRRTGSTYSRRFIENATIAARNAIRDRFARNGRTVKVEPAITDTLHRVVFSDDNEVIWPKISIIIPNRDKYELISNILSNLFERTDYPDFEVIVVDNGSTEPAVLELYAEYERVRPNFRAIVREEKFNFARAINRGMANASGDHFLLLNNDVEVIDDDWLKEMVSCLGFDNTGIVGAKLLYPNGSIQHAGVIAGFGGLAGHWYHLKPRNYGGPMNRLHLRNSMTCVTGAVMLISGECAREIGPWDEDNFAIAYNDIDYCLRAHKAGYRIVWTPFACLYHHESLSRGSDMTGERKKRFEIEQANLRRIHGTDIFGDPAINPGYEKNLSTPGFQIPFALPAARPGITAQTSKLAAVD